MVRIVVVVGMIPRYDPIIMKTLAEYNAEKAKQYMEWKRTRHLTGVACDECGVACDECGVEMHYSDDGVLACNPPKRNVHYPSCKRVDYIRV